MAAGIFVEMTQEDADRLAAALRARFRAELDVERVGDHMRYRFAVVSPDFAQMPQLQRQDAVWGVVDATLPREATLDVSLILTFAPGELAEAG
jgi:acid stress-induced BolA-like protein IbaG/YrbA